MVDYKCFHKIVEVLVSRTAITYIKTVGRVSAAFSTPYPQMSAINTPEGPSGTRRSMTQTLHPQPLLYSTPKTAFSVLSKAIVSPMVHECCCLSIILCAGARFIPPGSQSFSSFLFDVGYENVVVMQNRQKRAAASHPGTLFRLLFSPFLLAIRLHDSETDL